MKPACTPEQKLLQPAEAVLRAYSKKFGSHQNEARLQTLEAAASRLGGFDLEGFHRAFSTAPVAAAGQLMDTGRRVVAAIESSGIPPALALSALAREELDAQRQRGAGAYHTDFRLALHLASVLRDRLKPGVQVLDPACGAGILLSAVSHVACGPDRVLTSEWLATSINAADLSPVALRGTLLALSCLTDDLDALKTMRAKWRVQDSLLASDESWLGLASPGFDVVVANPPWEKVKLSRHEFIRGKGGDRHYGADYPEKELFGYEKAREQTQSYAAQLAARYPSLEAGEADLYVAFTELLLKLAKPDGAGALLVPGGLIRSKNTEALRRTLLNQKGALSLTVMENRARFFAIDTRFKFLVVHFDLNPDQKFKHSSFSLHHGTGFVDGVSLTPATKISRTVLQQVRPDLTVPEVKETNEWRLFLKMQRAGIDWSDPDSDWNPDFCREVDMTRCRSDFLDAPGRSRLPLVEGRMVQPHRFGAKAYVDGRGRKARWDTLPLGEAAVRPQFWIPASALSGKAPERSKVLRAGFCDIAGQTNERSMMAALIPAGVACGNKVPTVLFPNDPSEDRLYLWTAIVNSLPFDWLLRRVLTTTVNYFLLLGLRLPALQPDSLPGRRLCAIARKLAELDLAGSAPQGTAWKIAELRAEADVLIAKAYGCDADDIECMLRDFPLIDRGQPTLVGETSSTITRDLVLSIAANRGRKTASDSSARVEAARRLGAVAYVLGDAGGDEDGELADVG